MFSANQPHCLTGEELWQAARYKRMDDCISDSWRDGNASLRDNVLALPPTRHEFILESPQTLEVIEPAKSSGRNLQSARNDRMLSRNLIRPIVRQRRCSECGQLSAIFFEALQRFKYE